MKSRRMFELAAKDDGVATGFANAVREALVTRLDDAAAHRKPAVRDSPTTTIDPAELVEDEMSGQVNLVAEDEAVASEVGAEPEDADVADVVAPPGALTVMPEGEARERAASEYVDIYTARFGPASCVEY